MRVTSNTIYDNFKSDNAKAWKEIDKLNTQISSGQKIQNSYEDSSVYSDVLRFEGQENELSGIKERTVHSKSLADASDSALNEFTDTLREFNTKLILASNDTLSEDNLEAIAVELEAEKEHMISLANTKFNGQYLFSGSATNVKPIDNNGKYLGNDKALMTNVGDGVEIQHNIDGKSLFLGDDLNIHKSLETNVKLTNKLKDEPEADIEFSSSSSIRAMIGDDDTDKTNDKSVDFFISGVKRDGTAFKDVVNLTTDMKVSDLLSKIEDSFGGDVDVELTKDGHISITDKKSGYSQIDFKMVGVQGRTGAISDLSSISGDKIINFSKSGFETVGGADEALNLDKQYFNKEGGVLSGNVALVSDGKFATSSSKLSEMMHADPMVDKTFNMSIVDVNGAAKEVELNLSNPSTFSVDGTSYDIYNASGDQTIEKTEAKDFTMGQLNNIIAMVTADKLPTAPGDVSAINSAIVDAKKVVDVNINDNGFLEIHDKSSNLSNIEFAMYDSDANDFTKTSTPSLSFMSNNAVTTSQAHLNFFDELDNIISSVRNGTKEMSGEGEDRRSIGIRNSINKLNQMNNHFNNAQSEIGIRSKSLSIAEEKATLLEINVKQLKSETTEVDMAETIMKLNQTTQSYQAMLQTISKVNSLSLLNYMK